MRPFARCMQCGYELAGCADDGACPECNLSVAESAKRYDALVGATPIERLVRLCNALCFCDLWSIAVLLILIVAALANLRPDSAPWVIAALIAPAVAVPFIAAWSLRTRGRLAILASAVVCAVPFLLVVIAVARGTRGDPTEDLVFVAVAGRSLALALALVPLIRFALVTRLSGWWSVAALALSVLDFALVGSATTMMLLDLIGSVVAVGTVTTLANSWLVTVVLAIILRQIAVAITRRRARTLPAPALAKPPTFASPAREVA